VRLCPSERGAQRPVMPQAREGAQQQRFMQAAHAAREPARAVAREARGKSRREQNAASSRLAGNVPGFALT